MLVLLVYAARDGKGKPLPYNLYFKWGVLMDHIRRHIRLKGYDYSQRGAYFVTICSFQRSHLFGKIIVGHNAPTAHLLCSCSLSYIGNIIDSEINKLESQFNGIRIDKYVVMPNHIHMIISIGAEGQEQCPAISDIIRVLKSQTTRQANIFDGVQGRKIWQYRYHDHIIRNEDDYQLIWNYIDTNPQRWDKDRYNQ